MGLIPLALYVHLPWCEKKCPYCDFNSHESQQIPETAYVDALLRDLDGEIEASGFVASRKIVSVFIGGGTPSLFSVGAIERLLKGISTRLPLLPDAEITLEANPGSVEQARLAGYVQAGVTRFSLGIQSFDSQSLQHLGRVHDAGEARSAVDAAATSGAATFNLDLMHGLPEQTAAQGLTDIETAIATGAPHVSWYQLTIEPNTRFYSHTPALPLESELGRLEDEGCSRLLAAGYERYEISAWAKAGERCQHNLNYWQFGDYLAIGAGAHGKLSGADGEILRYAKTRRPEDYLANQGTGRRNIRRLSRDERIGEFMMNTLRLADGFSEALFESRTGRAFCELEEPLGEMVDKGLLTHGNCGVRATDLGWRYLDDVVGRFFTDPQA